VRMMVVEPVMSNQYYKFGSSHFVCCFASQTIVCEIRTVNNELIPLFPPFMPLIDFSNLLWIVINMLVSASCFSYLL
jgi:hypothetical protein